MDKARSREFVERLPARSTDELCYKEQVSDRQVLLNEEWCDYAIRSGKSTEQVNEEHVKWITETWDEFELRKRTQQGTLAHYDAKAQVDMESDQAQAARGRERSDHVIAHLMKFRNDARAKQTPSRHHLYADFDAYQRTKFAREQHVIATAEALVRAQIENWQRALCTLLLEAADANYLCMAAAQTEREAREAAERKRLEEERQRAAEEERRRELERRRLEEEEAQRKKEQAELEKRLERKRREEERRAKARADRERQKEAESAQVVECTDSTAEAAEDTDVKSPALEEEISAEVDAPQSSIAFQPLEGDNIISLFKAVTKILSSGGDNCYIMAIRKKPCASSVVCQNGFFAGEENEMAPLLGKVIDSETCISVSSERLHSAFPDARTVEQYVDGHIECIANVQENDTCVPFCPDHSKEAETLELFPVFCEGVSYSPYVVGFCRAGVDAVPAAETRQIADLVFTLCQRIAALQRQAFLHQLCQQCVEWINVSTGCENVYVSLRGDTSPDLLTYVAASESHRFMLGKQHARSHEAETTGISFTTMDASAPERQVRVRSIADVSDMSETEFRDKAIRFYVDGQKKGPLLVAPITGVHDDEGECVGVVFLDRIGSKKKFSPIDIEITRAATQLLADIILGNEVIPTLKLKIEDDMGDGPGPITFLKVLWHKSCEELNQITPNQLLELAKYLHPPPIIPLVVQATLLVSLGCKPKSVEDWDEARKRVTRKLLDKMLVFDPTDTKSRKRAFFIRSRKLLKGMTADAVFEKGSYPTQCFFKWTFTALLLRKHAEAIQKQLKDGRSDPGDVVSLFSNSTVGAESIDEDDDYDDTVEDNTEET